MKIRIFFLFLRILVFCQPLFAQNGQLGDNYLTQTVDSLERKFMNQNWQEIFSDSMNRNYSDCWYAYHVGENILSIRTSGVSCQPSLTWFEFPDGTLWLQISVTEADYMSMLPPEKNWIYHIINKKISAGTVRMENLNRPWNCNRSISASDVYMYIYKFYLYKESIR